MKGNATPGARTSFSCSLLVRPVDLLSFLVEDPVGLRKVEKGPRRYCHNQLLVDREWHDVTRTAPTLPAAHGPESLSREHHGRSATSRLGAAFMS